VHRQTIAWQLTVADNSQMLHRMRLYVLQSPTLSRSPGPPPVVRADSGWAPGKRRGADAPRGPTEPAPRYSRNAPHVPPLPFMRSETRLPSVSDRPRISPDGRTFWRQPGGLRQKPMADGVCSLRVCSKRISSLLEIHQPAIDFDAAPPEAVVRHRRATHRSPSCTVSGLMSQEPPRTPGPLG
jgi:hypothetical protein